MRPNSIFCSIFSYKLLVLSLTMGLFLSDLSIGAESSQTPSTNKLNSRAEFTDIVAGISGVFDSSVAWGDFDSDGDLDILISGMDGTEGRVSKIYRNDNGLFADINAGLIGVDKSSVAWGDYDNDGDLDILLAGASNDDPVSKVYRNDNGIFSDINAELMGVRSSAVAWGDYDGDGDLDILLTGYKTSGYNEQFSALYRNDRGIFTETYSGLIGISGGSVEWGDYDQDGDLDIVLSGYSPDGRITKVYRNDLALFTDIDAGLQGLSSSSLSWGDYDSDGDLDLLLSGTTNDNEYNSVSLVYRNDNGSFVEINAGLIAVGYSSAAWGDYDNDGDLDILLAGFTYSSEYYSSHVYKNEGGVFELIDSGLPSCLNIVFNRHTTSAKWGDYDNDGDLDIFLAGVLGFDQNDAYVRFARVYRNDTNISNTPPTAPSNLSLQSTEFTTATLVWDAASDNETPSEGLSYNLRVGTTPGGNELKIPMADYSNGLRRIVRRGNAGQSLIWRINLPGPGTYYWSVQAIDGAMAGSAFASESSFEIESPGFVDIAVGLPGVNKSTLSWGDFDIDGDLDILLTGYDDQDNGISQIYRNDEGEFTNIHAGLVDCQNPSGSWIDYDNDGDLDLSICGTDVSKVYRNDQGVFTDIEAGLDELDRALIAWGDYDNDGDPDLLLFGSYFPRLYRNENGNFVSSGVNLPAGLRADSISWSDYDNDGDLDILLTSNEEYSGQDNYLGLFRNDSGTFTEVDAGLVGLANSSTAWGDYDNDGDLDLFLSGRNSYNQAVSCIYRNENGLFTETESNLIGVYFSSACWGDFDNDGDLDLLLSGRTDSSNIITKLYSNIDGVFVDVDAQLTGVSYSSVSWGDFDNDGDLDILQSGIEFPYRHVTKVYRNDSIFANTPPTAPENLNQTIINGGVELSWESANDAQAPPGGLSYNLRLGTTPGGTEISSAMSDGSTGYRMVVQPGNVNQHLSWAINLPGPGTYYWSVQAIDRGFAGGAFAAEHSFEYFPLTPFADINPGLPGLWTSSVAWGDYDNDNDLDVIITGATDLYGYSHNSSVYRNDNGVFVDIYAGLHNCGQSAVAWGDYDNDGDLDILLSGYGNYGGMQTNIYRNDNGNFEPIDTNLIGLQQSAAAWGDYDNDGDLDFVLSGALGSSNFTSVVYQNDNGNFSEINSDLLGVRLGSVSWGDYDNDADLDLLIVGRSSSMDPEAKIYRNDGGEFVDMGAMLRGMVWPSAAWGDYDNDGDLDILLTGQHGTYSDPETIVYRNDGGEFTDIGGAFVGVSRSSVAWGDYDNDGDLDILLTGMNSANERVAMVYSNTNGSFLPVDFALEGVSNSSVAWGDFDNDNDLDILLTGHNGSQPISHIYKNNLNNPNSPPTVPGNLYHSKADSVVTLSWESASDTDTPEAGLSYNIRIGTSPGGNEISAAMADSLNGFRRVAQLGNAGQNLSWSIRLPESGTYYWSVQAIDSAWIGGAFSPEQLFSIENVSSAPGSSELQNRTRLLAAYPNPFNPRTTIGFELKDRAFVSVRVFDLAGKLVDTVVNGTFETGMHEVVWQGKDSFDNNVASGIYMYQLRTPNTLETRHFTLLR